MRHKCYDNICDALQLEDHASGKGAKYTKTFAAVKLVYFEKVADRSAALKREYALKQLKKEDKEALVSTMIGCI